MAAYEKIGNFLFPVLPRMILEKDQSKCPLKLRHVCQFSVYLRQLKGITNVRDKFQFKYCFSNYF